MYISFFYIYQIENYFVMQRRATLFLILCLWEENCLHSCHFFENYCTQYRRTNVGTIDLPTLYLCNFFQMKNKKASTILNCQIQVNVILSWKFYLCELMILFQNVILTHSNHLLLPIILWYALEFVTVSLPKWALNRILLISANRNHAAIFPFFWVILTIVFTPWQYVRLASTIYFIMYLHNIFGAFSL
jgi:hypothetical protein